MIHGCDYLNSGVSRCGLGLYLVTGLARFSQFVGLLLGSLLSGMWIYFVWIHGCKGALILDFWGRSEAD